MSDVTQRPSRLDRLTAPSRAITYSAPLRDVLQITVHTAEELLDAERVVLMLQESEDRITIRAAVGLEPETMERLPQSLDETLVERLNTVFGDDLDDRFLGVPLVVGGKIIGLLAVLLRQPRQDERDEWLLSALADQAALALAGARQAARATDLEKRLAALQVQDERQEQALRVVRHDLRTPLGAIRGYVDLMQRGVYGPVTERQRTALDRLWVATSHLDSLVDNAIEMSRLQAGEVRVACTEVRLADVVEEAFTILELQARDARIDLGSVVPPDLIASADAPRLRQVLVQLIDNALKHGPPHSTVKVSAGLENGETPMVSIRVSDDGPGVAPEHAAEIFEPYRRFGSGMGSGLGLTIAKAVTDLMSGSLELDRDAKPGATFVLRLPAR